MSCIFCKIGRHDVKSGIVFESDAVIAFDDIAPQAPVHVVIIPKEHVADMPGLNSVLGEMFNAAIEVSRLKGVAGSGFRIVMNSGIDSGQAVGHMHFHLLGGRKLSWPPG